MSRLELPENMTARESLEVLTVEQLKWLIDLTDAPSKTRKADLVQELNRVLTRRESLKDLYNKLPDLAKFAVQEATHDPHGTWRIGRFAAKYGDVPELFDDPNAYYLRKPSLLRLFFPAGEAIPTDTRALLVAFVPKPPPLTLVATADIPTAVQRELVDYAGKVTRGKAMGVRVRERTGPALNEVQSVLRLVDAGEVRVSDKTRKPTAGSVRALAAALEGGDFYPADGGKAAGVADLTIRGHAWPTLLMTAKLVEGTGVLKLTAAGRAALSAPPHETLRKLFDRWHRSTLEEYARVSNRLTGLTAVGPRREVVLRALLSCPVGQWVQIAEVFRLIRATEDHFAVVRATPSYYDEYEEEMYGEEQWYVFQGRYVAAVLFEYAATLGLIDVAYALPREMPGADLETDDRDWGTRYNGLLYVRLTELGAWLLGDRPTFTPPLPPEPERLLRVLPNLDVVAPNALPPAADVLFLNRVAEQKSPAVWHLDKARVFAAVEKGFRVPELRPFLLARSLGDLPSTATVFLDDVEQKAEQLTDLGDARVIVCADPNVALLLSSERKIRKLCWLAGDRHIVFRAADEAAVRKAIRDAGYALPPPATGAAE